MLPLRHFMVGSHDVRKLSVGTLIFCMYIKYNSIVIETGKLTFSCWSLSGKIITSLSLGNRMFDDTLLLEEFVNDQMSLTFFIVMVTGDNDVTLIEFKEF